mgnify:CR=1 FL=1
MRLNLKNKTEMTRDASLELYFNKVRDNLHFVFCFSPIGDKLKNRFRKVKGRGAQ